MKRTIIGAVALMLVILPSLPARAQDSPKSIPKQDAPPREATGNAHGQLGVTGQVNIGDMAPDFELDGSHGAPVKLSSMRGDWLLLVFSDRRDDFVSMRGVEDDLRKSGVRTVGVCHEKARTLDNYPGRDSVPLMLADVTGEVSTTYGLFDSAHRKVVPGFFVLDREGYVRIAFFGRALPPEEIARLTQFAVGTL